VTGDHRLYVLTAQGGSGPLSVAVTGNPRIDHDPVQSLSVHTLMLTPEGVEEVVRAMQALGVTVQVRPLEGMAEEQQVEQARLLGRAGQEERVWPTANCPSCFWFDPLQEGVPCGAFAWTMEARREAHAAHEAARVDLDRCPLSHRAVEALGGVLGPQEARGLGVHLCCEPAHKP